MEKGLKLAASTILNSAQVPGNAETEDDVLSIDGDSTSVWT